MQDHIVASFAPGEVYTRHSEGSFLRLKDGRIMFVYSRFTNGQGDDAPSNLAATYSSDEGETWTEPQVIISAAQYNVKNIMSVSMMRMQNGDLGIFYIVKHDSADNIVMLSRSDDEGKTFYRHVQCTLEDRPGYYVLNNDRVLRLSTGRLLMPLAFHRGGYNRSDVGQAQAYFDGRAFACFLYSDDDGDTWKESPDTVFPSFNGSHSGLQETGVVEKKNGVVWAYNRTDMMYQYEYFSMDGGLHWTKAQPSRFTSPCSPMKLARHPETGDLYSVWNPIPNYNGRKLYKAGWGRTPIVWAVSKDDGASWSDYTVIEGKDENGYCYPAVFFTKDKAMLVGYCAGGPEDGICLARLTIKKLNIE